MEYSLKLVDRHMLSQVLAGYKGNLVTVRMVRTLKDKLEFTADELEQHELKVDRQGNIRFPNNVTTTFDLATPEVVVIQDQLRELEQNGGVGEHHLPLYDLFLPDISTS